MNIRNTLILTTALLVSVHSLRAGEVRKWSPAALFERAEVVIIGRPTQITATEEKGTIRFGYRKEGREIPIAFFTAKVQVVEVVKGENIEKEVTLTYSKVDYTRIPAPVHVQRIWLREDVLHLFYLNPTKDGVYVGALNREFHQGQAAKALESKSTEQGGADQPSTAPESKSDQSPKPESEGRSQ